MHAMVETVETPHVLYTVGSKNSSPFKCKQKCDLTTFNCSVQKVSISSLPDYFYF